MPKVKRKHENEHFESLLRRFKRACDKADTLLEFRKHEQFEKPSVKRKRKKAAAVKREQKRVAGEKTRLKRLY